MVGGRTRVKVVKNKVAPPFREAEFDVMYGEGISKEGDLLDLAVERKIVEKSGTWFAYSGERLGQGRENVKQFLKDNPAIFKSIEDRVRAELGLTVTEAGARCDAGSTRADWHRICRARVVQTRASLWYHYCSARAVSRRAEVAQLVEHSTENAGVTGSIPVLGTNSIANPESESYSLLQ